MIGLFDSGSGGLTVLKALREKAPHADIEYFGDIANAPYGIRSAEELADLTRKGVRILREHGATELVSACNSVSTSVLAGAAANMPFVEMSLPTAEYLRQFVGQRFLLIATPATIASRLYEKAVVGAVELDSLPIADLAGAIEFGEPEENIEQIIADAFSCRRGEHYDGLILGCTHYPLVRRMIERIASDYFGSLQIIDPAHPVADAATQRFGITGKSTTRFLISQESDTFRRRVEVLFAGTQYSVEITQPLKNDAVLVG